MPASPLSFLLGMVTNYGEGGATKREGGGGHVNFYLYIKEGGGGTKSFSHAEGGGGAQQIFG